MEKKRVSVQIEGRSYSLITTDDEKYVQKVDKRKADYHRYYTGLEWTDARNYDLCLDRSKLGFERCVDEIIAYMNVRFQD